MQNEDGVPCKIQLERHFNSVIYNLAELVEKFHLALYRHYESGGQSLYRSDDMQASFSIYLPSSKHTISLILFTGHDTTDIADPSCMRDACHMNFVVDLTHRGVCGSVVRVLERD